MRTPRHTTGTVWDLGPMPTARRMTTVDERVVHAPLAAVFSLARRVEEWPAHLAHYRFVRFHERAPDGGGVVTMAADRPFGPLRWPTWWCSQMAVTHDPPAIRFRHIDGITSGMDVEWTFRAVTPATTAVRIVHVWNGPGWPLVGRLAAVAVIGPVFVHGIASRTLARLAAVAERSKGRAPS